MSRRDTPEPARAAREEPLAKENEQQ